MVCKHKRYLEKLYNYPQLHLIIYHTPRGREERNFPAVETLDPRDEVGDAEVRGSGLTCPPPSDPIGRKHILRSIPAPSIEELTLKDRLFDC